MKKHCSLGTGTKYQHSRVLTIMGPGYSQNSKNWSCITHIILTTLRLEIVQFFLFFNGPDFHLTFLQDNVRPSFLDHWIVGWWRHIPFAKIYIYIEREREICMSSYENPVDIPLYWLVNRDPYIGLL